MSLQESQLAPLVEARGIVRRYGPTTALADGRLTVLPGESHALVGRNGAGKSTLVSVLTGLQAPDEGTVRFDGEPAPPLADRDAWRRKVACVYQTPHGRTRVDGRREPLHQPPAPAAAASSAGGG